MAQNDQLIQYRYGKALFEAAVEKDVLDEIAVDLRALSEIFKENPMLGDILTDIRLSESRKLSLVKELKMGAQVLTQNFLSVVFEAKRMNVLIGIISEFEKRYNKKKGLIKGRVTTAVPLTQKQKDEIIKGLTDRLGIQNVEITENVDAKIIGGVVVEADGQIIDGSVRTQLNKLKNLIKQV
ncbi:MAG: F0F1 ATP synthase subunit delta [Streptococcaceae bacterium]|jgi:F-type H+-transporting ATPase subunit delta|nr:F0F1 ATP synthase subunit delta [Streptococcaceae bacterium]